MSKQLHEYDEDELVDELVRRGWRHKETKIPVGYSMSPVRRARQLQRIYAAAADRGGEAG